MDLANLPGAPAARRKEVLRRMGAIEARLDVALIKEASRKAPSTLTPTPTFDDLDVELFARDLGTDGDFWVKGSTVYVTHDEEGRKVATMVYIPTLMRSFTPLELLQAGLDGGGHRARAAYERLSMEVGCPKDG